MSGVLGLYERRLTALKAFGRSQWRTYGTRGMIEDLGGVVVHCSAIHTQLLLADSQDHNLSSAL